MGPAVKTGGGSRASASSEKPVGGAFLSGRNLTKTFGGKTVIDDIDFDIAERSFTTLLGPSGCGKTTLLRIVAGFETPDVGTLNLDGRDMLPLPPERRPVNTVFQSYALFPHMSVFDNVNFPLSLRFRKIATEQRTMAALAAVHMAQFKDRYPHQLSGGQQQRVAVARAIVCEPHILLLDEPFSALDRKLRQEMQIELKSLQRRLDRAFVFVTHDQEEAFALSDQIILMNAGKIVQRGDPQQVYRQPADRFAAEFIGQSTLVDGDVLDRIGADAVIATSLGKFQCPAHPDLTTGDRAVLVIRPQHLRPVAVGGDFTAAVTNIVFRGQKSMLEAASGGLRVHCEVEDVIVPGTTLGFVVDQTQCYITRDGRQA